MNKLNRVAALVAVAALSAGAAQAQNIDNWRGTDGTVWKNGTNEYCWRDNFWTPSTGVQGCSSPRTCSRTCSCPRSCPSTCCACGACC